jgi:MinD superfamily P-loop ATPase
MRKLLILSGKGGTGKTTVASALITLSEAKAYADCDVDAPNLHLVGGTFTSTVQHDYHDLPKAEIDQAACTECNRCFEVCRFGAILVEGTQYSVDPIACEGCTYCRHVCPSGAIAMIPTKAGDMYLHSREDEVFSTAQLAIGSGTTGKLVTEVKAQIKDRDTPLAILDGSPGIGCPVIASLTGTDLALMVAEPSISGLSDLRRVVKSARQLQVPVAIIVNKADINETRRREIESYCKEEDLPYLGHIPYDRSIITMVNEGRTLAGEQTPAAKAIQRIWKRTRALLEEL